MSEKSCDTCLYQGQFNKDECYAEQCNEDFSGWRNRVEEVGIDAPLIRAMDKAYNTYKDKFSLDKLIDDHCKYVEDMLRVHGTEEEAIAIVGFHYRSAFRHGYKHCLERHNIVEE